MSGAPQYPHNSLDLTLQLGKPWDRCQKPLDPAPESTSANDLAGIEWWNAISLVGRAYWLSRAGSASPVDAWNEYQRTERLLTLRWGAQ